MSAFMRLTILAVLLPLSAAAQPLDDSAFLDELKLGARLQVGGMHTRQDIQAIERGELTFLDRPVNPTFASYSPLVGIGAGLRFRRTEFFASIRTNQLAQPTAPLRWSSGGKMFSLQSSMMSTVLRIQHLFTPHIGLGIRYDDHEAGTLPALPVTIEGINTGRGIYESNHSYRALVVYLPIRYAISTSLAADAMLGTSVYNRSWSRYAMHFAAMEIRTLSNGERVIARDPQHEGQTVFNRRDAVSMQFGEVAVTYDGIGIPLRVAAQVRRTGVRKLAVIWQSRLYLRIGLPF